MATPAQTSIARREALRRLGVLTAGLASACTPLRIVLHDYPSVFDGEDASERVLRAFVLTVIPEADAEDPNLLRAFRDSDLRFAPYRGFFVSDLCQRAAARTGESFDRLSQAERLAVVQEASPPMPRPSASTRVRFSWRKPATTAAFTTTRVAVH